EFDRCLKALGIEKVDGFLLDLGVSSFQLDTKDRGFSFQQDAPLDMRMNREGTLTAKILVNTGSEADLAEIIFKYGEERWAKRIAKFIVEARRVSPVKTTGELVEIILKAVPKGARQKGLHPATRTFQALRIAVNNELGVLSETLKKVANFLNPGGRLVIISFHSLEDRLVKQNFLDNAKGCICPPEFPVCNCGGQPIYRILTKKPVTASIKEVSRNLRARSAKLRAAEKR
ncbi:MAG: 16S rRNA (cytosine(1402)-N(4))-methyltransferase RsmH, partial [Bacillota bacterium]